MKINYFFIACSLMLMGCTPPTWRYKTDPSDDSLMQVERITTSSMPSALEFKTEPLTGEEYCVVTTMLKPLKNSVEGELILKCSKRENTAQKPVVKAILKIAHKGREYTINPHEVLTLSVDGAHHNLDIVNSFKIPQEEIDSYHAGSYLIMTLKRLTRRSISFHISDSYLSEISTAKKVYFEITSSSKENLPLIHEYPVMLEIHPENLSLIRDFKNKCVDNFLNPSKVEK